MGSSTIVHLLLAVLTRRMLLLVATAASSSATPIAASAVTAASTTAVLIAASTTSLELFVASLDPVVRVLVLYVSLAVVVLALATLTILTVATVASSLVSPLLVAASAAPLTSAALALLSAEVSRVFDNFRLTFGLVLLVSSSMLLALFLMSCGFSWLLLGSCMSHFLLGLLDHWLIVFGRFLGGCRRCMLGGCQNGVDEVLPLLMDVQDGNSKLVDDISHLIVGLVSVQQCFPGVA